MTAKTERAWAMRIVDAYRRAARSLFFSLPVLLSVVVLLGLAQALLPSGSYASLFTGGAFDPLIGGALGSILAGNPVTSYVLGGELLEAGVSLLAVSAFLIAWVTVGLVQLPAEAAMLGRRFAIVRNAIAFILSLIVAVVVVAGVGVWG